MDNRVLMEKILTIGVISDTHRELPALVFNAFHDVDHIIHAGDIGAWDVVLALQALAPVTAVYGNCDGFGVRKYCQPAERLQVNGLSVEVTHIPARVPVQAPAIIHKVKIFGHLHVACIEHFGDTLYINPGSASRPRDDNGPTVALLKFRENRSPHAQIITLR
jgi:uncharacterized protein